MSIRDLAHMVKASVGSDSDIEYVPYSAVFDSQFEDMQRRVPDISKIRDLIGFQPQVQLPEIISRTRDYWRESPDIVGPPIDAPLQTIPSSVMRSDAREVAIP